MATVHSFFIEPESWQAPFVLSGPEAHHLSRVLRLKVGTVVRLFDGQGRSGLFRLTQVQKQAAHLEVCSEEYAAPPANGCTLATGFSKALRRSWFLEKAVELDASALWFWQGDYSQATLPETEKQTWRASLIAGAKQCQNPWLPSLATFSQGVEAIVEKVPQFERAFVLYEGDTKGKMLTQADLRLDGPVLLVIGPEGGFSPREIDVLLGAGIEAVSLGSRVLRWETAAILSLGLAWWARQ